VHGERGTSFANNKHATTVECKLVDSRKAAANAHVQLADTWADSAPAVGLLQHQHTVGKHRGDSIAGYNIRSW